MRTETSEWDDDENHNKYCECDKCERKRADYENNAFDKEGDR